MSGQNKARNNVHGTGIVIDGCGLLIRGRSGAGKSLLALDLLEFAGIRGEPVFLVADDQVIIRKTSAGLEMSAPPSIIGKIELRGRGIINRASVKNAPVHIVVELMNNLERMVVDIDLVTQFQGVTIARCPVPERGITDPVHQRLLVFEAIARFRAPLSDN